MSMLFENVVKKNHDRLYFVFRLLVGGMFFMHGSGKLFGWFGGPGMGFSGLMGFAGVVESLAGLGIFFGFWTRLSALGGAADMVGAYVIQHLGWNPLATKGELALLYLASFLVLFIFGARKWSMEKAWSKKERF